MRVWNLATAKLLTTLEGHTGSVYAVAVTPDGAHLVTAGADNALRVWDLETGGLVASYVGDGRLKACAVAPDGRTIVAGEASGHVRFLRFTPPGQLLPLLARLRHCLRGPNERRV